jgi:hypothetical protein
MAMSEREWRELLARKRSSSRRKSKVHVWFAILAPFVCAAALVPSLYILLRVIESLPHLSIMQDRAPNHADSR